MKKMLLAWVALVSIGISANTQAAQGEYWELSTTMEMVGMPFVMPAQKSKVCIPKGGEKEPKYMQGKNSHCKMTKLKQFGNKVTWKGSCVNDGQTMHMTGESTHGPDHYHGTTHMSGTSKGRKLEIITSYSSKRIGGSCETVDLP